MRSSKWLKGARLSSTRDLHHTFQQIFLATSRSRVKVTLCFRNFHRVSTPTRIFILLYPREYVRQPRFSPILIHLSRSIPVSNFVQIHENRDGMGRDGIVTRYRSSEKRRSSVNVRRSQDQRRRGFLTVVVVQRGKSH